MLSRRRVRKVEVVVEERPVNLDNHQRPETPAFTCFPVYDELLNRSFDWALLEGSRHFDEASAVFRAMFRTAALLEDERIPYAVVGGIALFKHGLRQYTQNVDFLVRRHDLAMVHELLLAHGYREDVPGSPNLREPELGVQVKFFCAGDFPVDGRSKPVCFPDPASDSIKIDGVSYISLIALFEIKIAAGQGHMSRLRYLAEAQELMKRLKPSSEFADRLHPSVRETFLHLWRGTQEYDPHEPTYD